MDEVPFGEWLKRQRSARGLTQTQLAQQVGCATITLRKIESEQRRPSAQIGGRLAEIFNIPSNERKTFLHFARGDWISTTQEVPTEVSWQTSVPSPRSNLPALVTSLIGRDKEIADVREYLLRPGIRLVSLIGPPGIGKTRLGIESARGLLSYFPDGVFFAALAPLDNPAQIAIAVAQSLGYVGARNISAQEQLTIGTGEKQMLIVLDNLEQIIEGAAPLISDLLSACPRLKILTTSREALRVPGEWLYHVPTLETPTETQLHSLSPEGASQYAALTLFSERARAVRSDFVLDADNFPTVAAICTRLDGLPLAIELIAARIRFLSPQALLAKLNNQFVLSADGMRAVPARQKTLHNAISWSYNLLSAEEQNLFVRLSVFSGGFTLDAAEAVFSRTVINKTVSDLIVLLLDKSLLQRTLDFRGEPHFNMLVTIQQFAIDHLRQRDEETEARNWHLAYFLDLAERGDQEMHGPGQIEWLTRLNAMRDNLRAGLEWAMDTRQTGMALQLVRKLHWFWFMRGDFVKARHWFRRVLDMPDTYLYPEAQAEALSQLAYHSYQLAGKEVVEGRSFLEQALSIARLNSDRQTINKALAILGLYLKEEGNSAAAQSVGEESKAFFQQVNDDWEYNHAVLCLAVQSVIGRDWELALALFHQALAGFQNLDDTYFQSVALRYIGRAYVNLGDVPNGGAALQKSLILAQQLDNKFQIALILWRGFAEAALRAEKTARAVSLIAAAINIFQSIGAWTEQDDVLFENELAPCKVVLHELAYVTALEEGRTKTLEQAVTYALEHLDG